MKFSERWLREWVNPPLNTKELAEQLTMAGLEIESITPVAGSFKNVLIGKVLDVKPHPHAERLRICQVDVGQTELLTIVCGGVNVRADLKVPVAIMGSVLPDGRAIKPTKLRDVLSQGMICAATELGLAETSAGIMELPDDAPIGKDFRDWLQLEDCAIDLHITPNRGDCLSVAGIAREIAVLNNCELISHSVEPIPPKIQDQLSIQVQNHKDCPRYLGRVICAINPQAKTPMWMMEKLRRSGLRSIHPIVDVTNYVLLELGQPLHAFDLVKLVDGIEVRFAKKEESIVLLDGQEINLDPETLVIADKKNAQAIAGIMGGLNSAVTESTIDIFLESAFFNPVTIASCVRQYRLNTDAAHHFERGVDPHLPRKAIERATQLLLEVTGGQPGPVIEIASSEHLPKSTALLLRQQRIERVLGVAVPAEKVEKILHKLDMKTEKQNGTWRISVPSYRFDLLLEEDIIEEIARIHGYEKIPKKIPQTTLQFLALSEEKLALSQIRKLFVDRGYHEAITYSFVSPKLQKLIDPEKKILTLINPISADLSVMRTSLWPGLLNAVSYNQNRQQARVRLFEIGLRFTLNNDVLNQEQVLAGVVTGDIFPEQWGIAQRPVDFFDLKGDLENLLTLTKKMREFTFHNIRHPALHPGQSSALLYQGKSIGYLGALHPALLQQLELIGPVYLFELQLEAITRAALPQFKTLSKFPAIRRDISFWIEQSITVQEIFDLIRKTAGELLIDLGLFDVYQGKGVEPDFRSLALSLLLQHSDRTLVDAEVNALMEKIITTLKQTFKINLRD